MTISTNPCREIEFKTTLTILAIITFFLTGNFILTKYWSDENSSDFPESFMSFALLDFRPGPADFKDYSNETGRGKR